LEILRMTAVIVSLVAPPTLFSQKAC